jgi:hypothetical protein
MEKHNAVILFNDHKILTVWDDMEKRHLIKNYVFLQPDPVK